MKNEKQEEAQKPARKLLKAYRSVFGREGSRTEAQKLVLADMERRGYVKVPSFLPDASGGFCPLRAALTDGRRAFAIETLQRIEAKALDQEDKPKPKTKT